MNALSFFINTQIAGLAPVFLRVANVLLHTLNTVLVCVLLKNVFSIDVEQTKARQGGVVYLLAFMGGLFFAVNPVAVYATVDVVQRSILLATFFALWSMISLIKGLVQQRPIFFYLTALCFFLAIHSKEHAIMLLFCYGLVVTAYKTRPALKVLAVPCLIMAVSAVQLVLSAKGILGQAYEPKTQEILKQAGPVMMTALGTQTHMSLISAFNQTWLFFRYLLLWLVPLPGQMSIDVVVGYAWQFFKGPQFLGPVLFTVYGALGFVLLNKKKIPVSLAFGLLVPLFLFMTEFSVIRLHEVFVIYRAYLWGAFVYLLLGIFLQRGTRFLQLVFIMGLVLAGYFAVVSFDRMATFRTPLDVWQDACNHVQISSERELSLNAWRPFASLARILLKPGTYPLAIENYQQALRLNPDSLELYNNIGVALSLDGQRDEAVRVLNDAIKKNPRHYQAYYNLAVLAIKEGRQDEALNFYHKVIELKPDHLDALFTLGRLYFAKRQDGAAKSYFNKVLQLNPKDDRARYYLKKLPGRF